MTKAREKRWLVSENSFTNETNTETDSKLVPPILRSQQLDRELDGDFVINLKRLKDGLTSCQYCENGPLTLENTEAPSRLGLGVTLHVGCSYCGETNRIQTYDSHRIGSRGPEAVNLNTTSALAMLHTGQGHTHLNADLSVMGIGSISSKTYKKREREVGTALEAVSKKSCHEWKEKEKACDLHVDSEGDSLLCVSYDGAWQKRGKARDSTTGFGTVIGQNTRKVLDYGIKTTRCRTCEAADAKGQEHPNSHDCRKNHTGSSKSMECEIAVECFNAAKERGMKYSSYVADEDTTTESHIKYRVDYSTEKKTDRNHATRTLGSRLYQSQKHVKGNDSKEFHNILLSVKKTP